MSFNRTAYVVGREGKEGDIQDISISTTPEGLNFIQIARDAKDTSPRIYVVDRRVLPDGTIKRLLEVNSFSDVESEKLSEVQVDSVFESFPNVWGIEPEETYGLPEGMESPWTEPIEMVGNELLLPMDAHYVSGDAPVNIDRDNTYSNGKYVSTIYEGRIDISDRTGELLGTFYTNTSLTLWRDGVAGAATFLGGSLFIEPAKPPVFQGSFHLQYDPVFLEPGLYQYGDHYLVSSTYIENGKGVGSISFVKDPYPERWIPRLMGRAYTTLKSPSHILPLIEDEPSRISITPFDLPTDFEDIRPEIVTPYANKYGVFNAWEVEDNPVVYKPGERPYDVLIPFDKNLEDWGGFSVWSPVDFYPALNWKGEPGASAPVQMPYEMCDIPPMAEGVVSWRWKDSREYTLIKNNWLDISFKDGYIYFDNKVSPDSNGICKIITSDNWNSTKVEWFSDYLYVNDVEALIEENEWGEVLQIDNTWGAAAEIPEELWSASYDIFPIDAEVYEEQENEFETGSEEYFEPVFKDYDESYRTWGRILFEEYEASS